MKDIEAIVDEHAKLLKQRGYDEETLKNGFLNENIFDDLRRELLHAIYRMEQEGKPGTFVLKTQGLFNSNKDIVEYRLFYRLNSQKTDLDLCSLEVNQDGLIKSLIFRSSNELPSSQEAFDMLQSDRKQIHERNQRFFGKKPQSPKPSSTKKRGKRM